MPTQERARPPPVQSPRNPLPQGSDELQKNLRRKTKMKNYQSLYYKNYFAQNADGDYIPVNRKDCFAPGETPTPDNPFRQRWFYDPEAGYAVRLERNQCGEDTYLMNSASMKKGERQRVKRSEMIELDCPRYDETGEEGYIELEDETADVAKIIEDAESLATLIAAYKRLDPSDQLLFRLMSTKAKKTVTAEKMGMTLDGVYYREKRLRKILCSDPTLKDVLKFLD